MTTLLDGITKEQLATLFRKAFLGQEATLDRVAAFARQEPDFDPVAEMAAERAMGWSYRVASGRGVNGRLAEDDRTARAFSVILGSPKMLHAFDLARCLIAEPVTTSAESALA